jgi:hypothetical protein
VSAKVEARDKRVAPRTRVLGHAKIVSPKGHVYCVVRDLSDTGARLGVCRKVRLPPTFVLWFVKRNLRLHVRLRWREGDYAGVSFAMLQQAPKSARASRDTAYILDI